MTATEANTNTMRPPENPLAEESVIGALLIDRDAIIKVAHYLKAEDFLDERLALIYQAVSAMYKRNCPTDMTTLYGELDRMGKLDDVGWDFAPRIVLHTPTACHIEYYARMVLESAVRRAMVRAGSDIASMGYEKRTEFQDLMARAQQAVAALYDRSGSIEYTTAEQMAAEFADRLDILTTNPGKATGIPTGFARWDNLTGGLQPGSLVVIAARPGMGKTTWALNVAHSVANTRGEDGRRFAVCLFSLEMTRDEVMSKLVSIETGVSSEKVRTGFLTDQELSAVGTAVGNISLLPLTIDDRGSLHIGDLLAKAKRIKSERGLDLLIVDYLQLVHGTPRKNGLREQEVSEVARGLKEIAQSLKVPVLACCQLNRSIEQRTDKVPQLSDLRESGEIEQAADIVAFIHRDEEYDKESDRAGIADLYIKKHRNGPTGLISLYCDMKAGKFGDLAIVR